MCYPFIISGFAAAFIAALCWMAAMTKFDLSYAYPFMSIPFIFVLFLSAFFFQEPITIFVGAGAIIVDHVNVSSGSFIKAGAVIY